MLFKMTDPLFSHFHTYLIPCTLIAILKEFTLYSLTNLYIDIELEKQSTYSVSIDSFYV